MLGNKEEILTLARRLAENNPHEKRVFKTDLEFEHYWDDPDFVAIVGNDELPDKAEQAAPVTAP